MSGVATPYVMTRKITCKEDLYSELLIANLSPKCKGLTVVTSLSEGTETPAPRSCELEGINCAKILQQNNVSAAK